MGFVSINSLCSHLSRESAANAPGFPYEQIDWEQIVAEASAHRVLPYLATGFGSQFSSREIPQEISNLFAEIESLSAERNQVILAETTAATFLLNQIGILPVALKGVAYLLAGVYPNIASRYLLDVDLLIPDEHLERAFTHLKANGYFQPESGALVQFRHHYPPIKTVSSPPFELHRRVILGKCDRLLPAAKIFSRASPLELGRARLLIPSPTDLVNHLILHSQLAHPYNERIFPSMRDLVDLVQLNSRFKEQIDWYALAEIYKNNGEAATLILHLHQAHDLLGFKIPKPIPNILPLSLRLRRCRRRFLNRFPRSRFLDPAYLLMSLFSRRIRVLPLIIRNPSSWPRLLRIFTRPSFYRDLIQ